MIASRSLLRMPRRLRSLATVIQKEMFQPAFGNHCSHLVGIVALRMLEQFGVVNLEALAHQQLGHLVKHLLG